MTKFMPWTCLLEQHQGGIQVPHLERGRYTSVQVIGSTAENNSMTDLIAEVSVLIRPHRKPRLPDVVPRLTDHLRSLHVCARDGIPRLHGVRVLPAVRREPLAREQRDHPAHKVRLERLGVGELGVAQEELGACRGGRVRVRGDLVSAKVEATQRRDVLRRQKRIVLKAVYEKMVQVTFGDTGHH